MKFIKKYHIIFLSLIISFLFLSFCYSYDNKYTTPPPYGKDGLLTITEERLANQACFLIDGWELYEGVQTPKTLENTTPLTYTYVGEYSRFNNDSKAKTYRIMIDYEGIDQSVEMFFPEIMGNYQIYINGTPLEKGAYNATISFLLTTGTHELVVSIERDNLYYSGLYYPPILGSAAKINSIHGIQNFIYTTLIIMSITIAIFSLSFYRKRSNDIYLTFSFSSLSFAIYCSYFIVHLLKLPFENIQYLIENISFYALIYFLLKLVAYAGNLEDKSIFRKKIQPLNIVFSLIGILSFLFIPISNEWISIHSFAQNTHRIFIFICFIVIGLYALEKEVKYHKYIILGSTVFAFGVLSSIFENALFEPIYTCHQLEWCGFFMILNFASIIYLRYRDLKVENESFINNLEDLVESKSGKVTQLLEERKTFYRNVAHDLKAPLSASYSYLEILKNEPTNENVSAYLSALDKKLNEMMERVSVLNSFTGVDRYHQMEYISVNSFLQEINALYIQDAGALGIHFNIELLKEDAFIKASIDKLLIVFENLIYNAFDACKINDHLNITVFSDEQFVEFIICDTGKGIKEKDLDHIFEQYFSTNNKKEKNRGLGLFIAHNTVLELNGTITVTSKENVETTFYIKLPKATTIKNN